MEHVISCIIGVVIFSGIIGLMADVIRYYNELKLMRCQRMKTKILKQQNKEI